MLQLSKKVEYGLIALRHMAMNPRGQVFTAKEIAAKFQDPLRHLSVEDLLQRCSDTSSVRKTTQHMSSRAKV